MCVCLTCLSAEDGSLSRADPLPSAPAPPTQAAMRHTIDQVFYIEYGHFMFFVHQSRAMW
jgi:hypothetical protein